MQRIYTDDPERTADRPESLACFSKTTHPDSFPFSNYPMFACERDTRVLHSIVGTTVDGDRIRVPPEVDANDGTVPIAPCEPRS